MTDRKRIFIDTSAWIEFMLLGEIYHQKMTAYISKEIQNHSTFFTNDYVLDETFTRLATSQNFYSALLFRKKISETEKQEQLTILWMDETLFHEAWKVFAKYSDHQLSFTDATIITTVRKFKINEIASLDNGFTKAGFTVKPKL